MKQSEELILRREDFQQIEGDFYMSLRELSEHLGYSDSSKLWSLYSRHKKELEEYSTVLKMRTVDDKKKRYNRIK